MRTPLAAAILLLISAFPVRAQARASVTASATVVERIDFRAGPSSVAVQPDGALDVSTPVAVQGPAPYVVRVLRTGPRGSSTVDSSKAGGDAFTVLLTARREEEPTSLTYVIATIN